MENLNMEGSALDKIMPPISIFGGKAKKKEALAEQLQEYFGKYCGIVYKLRESNYL